MSTKEIVHSKMRKSKTDTFLVSFQRTGKQTGPCEHRKSCNSALAAFAVKSPAYSWSGFDEVYHLEGGICEILGRGPKEDTMGRRMLCC